MIWWCMIHIYSHHPAAWPKRQMSSSDSLEELWHHKLGACPAMGPLGVCHGVPQMEMAEMAGKYLEKLTWKTWLKKGEAKGVPHWKEPPVITGSIHTKHESQNFVQVHWGLRVHTHSPGLSEVVVAGRLELLCSCVDNIGGTAHLTFDYYDSTVVQNLLKSMYEHAFTSYIDSWVQGFDWYPFAFVYLYIYICVCVCM